MIIGSDDWIQWRKTKITATDAAVILGICPYKKPLRLWSEKLDLILPSPVNSAMQRGQDLEEDARNAFEKETNLLVFPDVVQHPTIPYLAATLDGISINRNVIVELKCNGPKSHLMALIGVVPDHHFAQVQHQIECAGLDFAYYYSFDGENGVIIEVKRDQAFIDNMLEKEAEFWHCIQNFIPPSNNKRQKTKRI